MGTMELDPVNREFLEHYGVKGMRWGVRRYKSKGSKAGAISRMTDSKLFKTFVFDKENSLLVKSGRAKVAKALNAYAAKRYEKALRKEKTRAAAKKARAAETRKLIKKLNAEDKAMSKRFGKAYDEAESLQYWERLFANDLKED